MVYILQHFLTNDRHDSENESDEAKQSTIYTRGTNKF